MRTSVNAQDLTVTLSNWQKQPPELFVLKNCSQKFRNINKKTPVLESLFHEVADLQTSNFIKKMLQHRCFPVANFLRNTYFEEHLRAAASELSLRSDCLEICFWTVAFKTSLTQ